MQDFGVIAFLVAVLGIGIFAGQGIASIRLLEEIKRDCDRHGATYIKDIRYSCKQEDHQPAKEPQR